MKTLRTLLVFSLLFPAIVVFGQQKSDCKDIVYLKDGSVYRGKISERTLGGNLVITTWSGLVLTIPDASVKKIVQRCKDEKTAAIEKPYSFKEKGLYNATRFGGLIGQDYFGESSTGFTLQHSAGWQFSRLLGVGLGIGIETYNPDIVEAATYPIFAELRGYLKAENVTPFYVVSGGWSFTSKNANSRDGFQDKWSGGWMAKAQIGYRFGNNFTLHAGLSLQKKTRDWSSIWGSDWGQDRILNKRLELGIGVIL